MSLARLTAPVCIMFSAVSRYVRAATDIVDDVVGDTAGVAVEGGVDDVTVEGTGDGRVAVQLTSEPAVTNDPTSRRIPTRCCITATVKYHSRHQPTGTAHRCSVDLSIVAVWAMTGCRSRLS